ncbi:NAD(P)/FAD-dependent oxidoreductase [Paraburkholderia silvatlantica]|uniref:Glycine/D-amino acid oxidase-like deaminating enzyme n=1 Tax=Paraburkholderia silvatlantica TaxID=321895 RepID=A0A2U1A4Z8_9BURK|nr:FAD-binding oxidoreductase [Paraburkholderia silvatlantica]MBB2931541.1 glycine/D-amino acid oxidase-like deaminating enzyme [Paraburkholderia silvatlantica]PVY26667.1 glycine/D-amino acid oxidase-like deaminating enzyme [Paraburkholderia silvatlantica]PXW32932.1 glycine/D-amino acid oxidase-like deaminating enzyme [Paraburkholderia silvatlantica]PYE14409.1 glycine/D-amino acid oxidase-like deaminating enzyme [Paraburkholderia silvatlantica]TDQ81682.1 glycine/D-amino acid oxidase-like deami
MGPKVDIVADDIKLPERADVVVVGGGIIGVSTALALSEKGLSVALCEKGHIAGEQSSRNWGWVRVTRRDPRELLLSIESLKVWRTLDKKLGIETGFNQCGILYVSNDDATLERHRDWLRRARDIAGDAFDTREMDSREISALLPGATRTYKGGIFTPGDARAEPQKAAPAIANALRERGVSILTPCAVRGVETSGGRVSAVVTEHGTIRCDAAVIAGGAWTRYFCGNLGVDLPQLLTRASVLRTEPIEGGPTCSANNEEFAFRKRLDGGYTVAYGLRTHADLTPDSFRLFFKYIEALKSQLGALQISVGRRFFDELKRPRRWPLDRPTVFESVRTLDPDPIVPYVDKGLQEFVAAFPRLSAARIAQRWAGYIDVTPDAIPIISNVARVPGLFIGTGFSGHGFGIGPGAGKLMADIVHNDEPLVDTHVFRLSRFSDGSKITIDAGF